jgi:hypothetical protein
MAIIKKNMAGSYIRKIQQYMIISFYHQTDTVCFL